MNMAHNADPHQMEHYLRVPAMCRHREDAGARLDKNLRNSGSQRRNSPARRCMAPGHGKLHAGGSQLGALHGGEGAPGSAELHPLDTCLGDADGLSAAVPCAVKVRLRS